MYKKTLLFLFGLFIFMLGIESCSRPPFACFTTSVNVDSVHVNKPVTFNAACTDNGSEFDWEFYNNTDSVEFGMVVTETFKDTGNVNVFLLVVNGNKTSSSTQVIYVNP